MLWVVIGYCGGGRWGVIVSSAGWGPCEVCVGGYPEEAYPKSTRELMTSQSSKRFGLNQAASAPLQETQRPCFVESVPTAPGANRSCKNLSMR